MFAKALTLATVAYAVQLTHDEDVPEEEAPAFQIDAAWVAYYAALEAAADEAAADEAADEEAAVEEADEEAAVEEEPEEEAPVEEEADEEVDAEVDPADPCANFDAITDPAWVAFCEE